MFRRTYNITSSKSIVVEISCETIEIESYFQYNEHKIPFDLTDADIKCINDFWENGVYCPYAIDRNTIQFIHEDAVITFDQTEWKLVKRLLISVDHYYGFLIDQIDNIHYKLENLLECSSLDEALKFFDHGTDCLDFNEAEVGLYLKNYFLRMVHQTGAFT